MSPERPRGGPRCRKTGVSSAEPPSPEDVARIGLPLGRRASARCRRDAEGSSSIGTPGATLVLRVDAGDRIRTTRFVIWSCRVLPLQAARRRDEHALDAAVQLASRTGRRPRRLLERRRGA